MGYLKGQISNMGSTGDMGTGNLLLKYVHEDARLISYRCHMLHHIYVSVNHKVETIIVRKHLSEGSL